MRYDILDNNATYAFPLPLATETWSEIPLLMWLIVGVNFRDRKHVSYAVDWRYAQTEEIHTNLRTFILYGYTNRRLSVYVCACIISD